MGVCCSACSLEEFDFHDECKRHGWSRLNVLVERLASELERFHYLVGVSDTRVEAHLVPQAPRSPALMGTALGLLSQQLGTVRTNCIDSLDRTNVVQSLLARPVLQSQLRVSISSTKCLFLDYSIRYFFRVLYIKHKYSHNENLRELLIQITSLSI